MVTMIQRSRLGLGAAVLLAGLVHTASPAFADKSSDLSLLPVDSELVGGLDFQQLQGSQLWKQFMGPLMAKNDIQKQMNEFRVECGVDPMKVVTKLSIGLKGLGNPHPDGVIVAHGVPKAKLVACYDKMVKKKGKDQNVTRDGDVLIVKQNGGSVAFSFVDNSTALIVVGTQATKDGIKRYAKGGSALKTSAAFVDLYKKTNTSDTLWLIMNGSSKAFAQMAALGIKPKAVYGSMNVTKDLNIDLRVRMKDAAAAGNITKMMNQQLGPAAMFVDKLSITADGADMHVSALITDTKLKQLGQQFGGMMGKP